MDRSIRAALLSVILGISVILTIFSIVDIASGQASSALWMGALAWPVVGAICGYSLWAERAPRLDED